MPENLPAARALLSKWGGLRATQKLIDARTRSAERTLDGLGASAGTAVLRQLLSGLARRKA